MYMLVLRMSYMISGYTYTWRHKIIINIYRIMTRSRDQVITEFWSIKQPIAYRVCVTVIQGNSSNEFI